LLGLAQQLRSLCGAFGFSAKSHSQPPAASLLRQIWARRLRMRCAKLFLDHSILLTFETRHFVFALELNRVRMDLVHVFQQLHVTLERCCCFCRSCVVGCGCRKEALIIVIFNQEAQPAALQQARVGHIASH
jgi:hypothetical protein